jgi:hypothetical protein
MLNNKWTHGKTHFVLSSLPVYVRGAEGILPFRSIIDPQVGSETALLLFDRTPFIYELAKLKPFNLLLKTGLVHTSHGPSCFLLFYVPDPRRPGSVWVAIDAHINPLEVRHLVMWRDLARQSHWHLILVDADDELVDFFEFENTFGLDETLDQIGTMFPATTSSFPEKAKFDEAKIEFSGTYSIEDLLKM